MWFLGCFFGVVFLGVLFVAFLTSEDLLSCMRIVCKLERPSELSWRAQHGHLELAGEGSSKRSQEERGRVRSKWSARKKREWGGQKSRETGVLGRTLLRVLVFGTLF